MFSRQFSNWQASPPPAEHFHASPNLVLVYLEVAARWPGMTNLGCYLRRPVRGGTAPSSHSYGAAIDIGYSPFMRELVVAQVLPFLVARSAELHVQAIHDYRGSRIWRAARTPNEEDACTDWWKAQRGSKITGMGQSWANHLHVETDPAGWSDNTPISARWVE